MEVTKEMAAATARSPVGRKPHTLNEMGPPSGMATKRHHHDASPRNLGSFGPKGAAVKSMISMALRMR